MTNNQPAPTREEALAALAELNNAYDFTDGTWPRARYETLRAYIEREPDAVDVEALKDRAYFDGAHAGYKAGCADEDFAQFEKRKPPKPQSGQLRAEADKSLAPALCHGVDFGTYRNAVAIQSPWKKLVTVDICMIPEIKWLWDQGIQTIESCCGHGKRHGYVACIEADKPKMEALGYISDPDAPHVYLTKSKTPPAVSAEGDGLDDINVVEMEQTVGIKQKTFAPNGSTEGNNSLKLFDEGYEDTDSDGWFQHYRLHITAVADIRAALRPAEQSGVGERPCTCHPDDAVKPCARRYASNECADLTSPPNAPMEKVREAIEAAIAQCWKLDLIRPERKRLEEALAILDQQAGKGGE